MRKRFRFRIWYLPVLGIVFGILYAFMFKHGLVVTWHFIGKPSENISEIVGVVNGKSLFVRTVSGTIYSIEYLKYINLGNVSMPSVSWMKEVNRDIKPDPVRKPVMTFIAWPLPFRIKQHYETTYQLVEGERLTKFALSEDGNLWMWNYGVGGMASLTYIIFPIIGLFIGSIFMLVIKIVVFIRRKKQPKD